MRSLLLVATLATLSLRALTPEGYMPGSGDSGLLFELCPTGMPVVIMRALGGDHHHHHGDDASGAGTEQCPIGHMLSAAVAADHGILAPLLVAAPPPEFPTVAGQVVAPVRAYRSRAPPA